MPKLIWGLGIIGALALALSLVPTTAHADLRVHLEGTGSIPIDRAIITNAGPGFSVGGAVDYEVVDLLSVGLFYTFTDFIDEANEGCGDDGIDANGDGVEDNPPRNLLDHAIGAKLDLRFVRHRTAGWFGRTDGNAYGEAFMELDLTYHYFANDHRIGWGFGMGYRVVVVGPFGLGPFFRFRHVVRSFNPDLKSFGHQLYIMFGLNLFLTFDVVPGDDDTAESPARETQSADEDGDWDDFEE